MIVSDTESSRRAAAEIVQRSGVIAFRTDTFYGLGANPLDARAVQKVRQLKGRADDKPILLLISDLYQVDRFVAERTNAFDRIASRHWPGPLTLVGRARPELPPELTAGTNSIGLRLPADDNLRAFVRICGGSLTATSANASGQPAARNANEVEKYFGAGIDLIVNSGEVTVTEPSTVLDVTGPKPNLIREGAISREQLKNEL